MQKMTVMALPKSVIDRMENRMPEMEGRGLWEKLGIFQIAQYRQFMFLHLLAFLLGRLTLLGDLAPFGLGFFAATAQIAKERSLGVAIAALLGVLSTGRYEEAGIYLVSMLVYFRMRPRLTKVEKKMYAVPVMMFLSVLVSGLIVNYIQSAALYEDVVIAFNAMLCMIAAHLFMYGIPMLLDRSMMLKAYEKPANETMVCLLVIFALAIAGIGDIRIFDYRIQNICSSLLVMLMALAGGAGLGAAVGVVLGTVIGLNSGGDALASLALYAVSGMIAGAFQSLGKFAVILGFIFGSVLVHLGFTPLPFLMESVTEGIIAAVFLLLLPVANLNHLQKNLAFGANAEVQPTHLLAESSYKLQSMAETFYEIGSLLGVSKEERPEEKQQENLTNLFSAVGNQVCEKCMNRPACWEENYYRTYQQLLSIFNHLSERPLQGKDMPLEFREECINAGKIVEVVNAVMEKERIHAYWSQRVSDQKQMISEQMKAAGNIITNLAQEMDKPLCHDGKFANVIRQKALQLGCAIESVKISGGNHPRQIEFEKSPCGKINECVSTLMPMIAGTLQERLTLLKKCGNPQLNTKCRICMKAANRYRLKTAVATVAKEGKKICGDSVKITPLNQGKLSLLLSDGMGSGSTAAKESRLTVDCLSKLLRQDFDVDVAVKTVNSLLLLQSQGEKFATVDMAIIDKYTGEAEFLKVAAAPSFVKRVREVQTVQAKALPIGILNQIEIEPIKMQLAPNDVLIMVSDGIADLKDIKLRSEDKEGWLVNFLRRSTIENEQKFAEAILQEAIRLSGGQPKDDMTVLVMILGEAGLI